MAHAEKRGKKWRVKYKLPSGEFGSESGFATKTAALKWGNDREAEVRNGRFVDPKKSRMTLGAWEPTFTAAQTVAPNTVAKRRRLYKTHIEPKWGHTPLDAITLFKAKSWAATLTCADSTRRHVMTLLSMMLTAAADEGLIHANPLFGRRITQRASKAAIAASADEEVWVEPEEAYAIAQRLTGVHRLMVITDAWTGLRWGELTGLHRDRLLLPRTETLNGKPWTRHTLQVDARDGSLHEVEVERTPEEVEEWLKAEEIRLAKAAQAGRAARRRKTPETKTSLFLGPPKNQSSVREVDLPPFLVDLLRAHLAVWPGAYPFSTPSGDFWRRSNFSGKYLRPAADGRPESRRRQGSPGRPGWSPIKPGLTMRGCRHTHDTWMQEDKVARPLRWRTMGWTVGDIEGTYEHITPEMRKHRLDSLEARWRRAKQAAPA